MNEVYWSMGETSSCDFSLLRRLALQSELHHAAGNVGRGGKGFSLCSVLVPISIPGRSCALGQPCQCTGARAPCTASDLSVPQEEGWVVGWGCWKDVTNI